MTEPNVIIVGAGGQGRELYSYIQDMNKNGEPLSCLGFVDDHKLPGPSESWTILGSLDSIPDIIEAQNLPAIHYITAVGNNSIRQQFVKRLDNLSRSELVAWKLCHPSAYVGLDVEIGPGTCLAPGGIITTKVQIGKHCIVNVRASVSHDCVIGDFVNINPAAVVCGNVKIGTGCYIGAGATIKDKVTIGEWTIVGAGAVVIDDLPPRVTAVGVPARIIKHL